MRWFRYVAAALMLVGVLGIAALQHGGTEAASAGASRWRFAAVGQVGPVEALRRALAPQVAPWAANVRANTDPTGNGQHEPGVAVSPVNPNVVVVANKDYRDLNVKRVWIEASTDGGQTWPTQLHMPGLPATDSESDPVVMARDDGRIYVSCLTTGNNGIFVTWSDDNGLTWQPSVAVVQGQTGLQDKDWFAIDNNPASPYYHRMYMAWAPGGVVSSYSTDGGSNWSAPQQIPNSGAAQIEYPYPVVARNGDVFLFHLYDWGARSPSPSNVKVVKSTNGGVSWSQPVSVATIYQPQTPPRAADQWRFFSIISAAADPSDNNKLYAAWTDDRNHNTNGLDVQYSASTDHGATWGPITRLSHDPTGVVRDHITPMLDVSADGRLHALWLDRRLDPANALFQAWYSSSTDGGASWQPDTQVSDAPGLGFDLNVGLPPGSGNAAGDYWGLDTAGGYVYAAWTDTRNSNQDIYTSRLSPASPTGTPASTPSNSRTPTLSPSSTRTATASLTPTLTHTASTTPSSTPTNTATATSTSTPTGTPV
ncbi:MAG: sialidase family protein, partial [Chloroflexia bacterium]